MHEPLRPNLLEAMILRQIKEIDQKIAELEQEKRVLNRTLLKARHAGAAKKDVNRKNSIERIIIETKIMEIIRSSKPHVSSASIYRQVKYVSPNLKDSTFRSHIHRLKQKGFIESSTKGYWRLPQDIRPSQSAE